MVVNFCTKPLMQSGLRLNLVFPVADIILNNVGILGHAIAILSFILAVNTILLLMRPFL